MVESKETPFQVCYRAAGHSNKQSKEKTKGRTPPVGLEPTTFELEVQHASPLRHGGC